jgi:hypothetical protein
MPIRHAAVIAGVCFLAITPFFWRGSPSGHDFEFHMFSWMDVLSQWKQGILYPRWAAMAHWGYGEARFLFYPPASWALGAALGAMLPWKMVPGAYCWLALMFSGMSMYRMARTWLPQQDALFAAALYAVNPYHLMIVYWRSAFAELLAAALLPMLLLAILRLREAGWRPVLSLGIVLAGAWLVNAPASVMIHYSAGLSAIVVALLERNWRPLWRTALAVVIGAGLASFYLIPTVYETRWVNIGEVLAPGLRPQDNFLFTQIPDAEHNQFNLLISTVAAVEIGVLLLAMWGSRRERSVDETRWLLLTCWGGAAALIMISITNPVWQHLPKLRFVQLPWRWLLCLNTVLALLVAMATRRWTSRVIAVGVLLGAVLVVGYRIQAPWWDTAADITEMSDAVADHTGYEGSDEYVPAGDDPYELKKDVPLVGEDHPEPKRPEILQWGPADKHIQVRTEGVELLTLRLFNYPAWEATVNGKRVPIQSADVTGQMALSVKPGDNDIQIHFGETRDRSIGGLISIFSLLLFSGTWICTRRPV